MESERPARRQRSDSSIWLICVLKAAFITTCIFWRLHELQIRQSKVTFDRKYHELNLTLLSTISENSHLNLSGRTCLKNLSALNSDLSDIKRRHRDLRHQFTEMETKYRSVNETKARICELLTSRREQIVSKDWIKNKYRRYYVSTFETTFCKAMQECSKRDSRLLEINSTDEASFVSHKLLYLTRAYWIGKCEDGTVGLALLYNQSPGQSVCRDCESYVRDSPCDSDQRFICEKSAPLFADIPEEIHGLCQQPVEAT
ncbi:uncharacterized protein LOC132390301 [Hypanus sabinus]|uniref:uncharacterized protein LOC132390301 n=1 Tax=Hypanus sabinus TaxID=79690 RepID=UPI0028C43FED|nr:uncharacterized protein LOC132390301 [Hypanus sabinus]